jgi:CTP synthase (UTP-ammonia lyase)
MEDNEKPKKELPPVPELREDMTAEERRERRRIQNLHNLENRKPFQSKDERQRAGTPKRIESLKINSILKKVLRQKSEGKNPLKNDEIQKLTEKEWMAIAQVVKAKYQGDTDAFKAVIERTDGKVTDKKEVSYSGLDKRRYDLLTFEELEQVELLEMQVNDIFEQAKRRKG